MSKDLFLQMREQEIATLYDSTFTKKNRLKVKNQKYFITFANVLLGQFQCVKRFLKSSLEKNYQFILDLKCLNQVKELQSQKEVLNIVKKYLFLK